jgi:hypothetical protein
MNLINEFALLFAVSVPVVTVVGAQIALFLGGERGTLLLPGFNHYPSAERVLHLEAPRRVRAMPAANEDFMRITA